MRMHVNRSQITFFTANQVNNDRVVLFANRLYALKIILSLDS